MNNTDDTQTIYTSWIDTVYANKGLKSQRVSGFVTPLHAYSEEDIKHLIWLLNEELNSRGHHER